MCGWTMRFTCLLLMGQAVLAIAADIPPAEAPVDHSQLLSYRDAAGKDQPVKTPADWQHRRSQILTGMQAAMGPLPDRTNLVPLDVKVIEETRGDGYLRQSITYAAEAGDRVPADLYLPTSRAAGQKVAAILALHPTGALGKRIVANEGPRANRGYALELAQRGYVVLAPDYPSFGDSKAYDFNADRYVSGTMKGIFNHMRGVDLLQARPEVDGKRIGVIGHSLGGHNAMFVAVFDDRISAIVSSCGWNPFHEYYGGKIKGWTSDRYMPRLDTVYKLDPDKVPFDFYEVVAALAPRAFLSVSPLHDANFEVSGVKKAIPKAQEVYKLLGVPEKLQVSYPDCEHDFPTAERRRAYEFFDHELQQTPARNNP